MDKSRWERIQGLFHEAVDLPPTEQDTFLLAACDSDTELIQDVRAMLREDSYPASVLDRSVAEIA